MKALPTAKQRKVMKLRVLMITVASMSELNAFAAAPALTIYNQNFAVVRDSVPLDLEAGVNRVRFAGTTAHVEPDSVMLRDPSGKQMLQILEQNYRADPLSQELLLSLMKARRLILRLCGKGRAVKRSAK